jgi:hypothetical protein
MNAEARLTALGLGLPAPLAGQHLEEELCFANGPLAL